MDFATWSGIGLLLTFLNIYLSCGLNLDYIAGGIATNEIRYDREFLLLLRNSVLVERSTAVDKIPNSIKINEKGVKEHTKRKRGCRAGLRRRLKRLKEKNKLCLPTTLLINAQSLRAKMDELSANMRYLHEYRNSSVLAITETWLDSNVANNEVEPVGFSSFRTDRDPDITGKTRGGGVCVLVRDDWCRAVKVRESLCTADIELLCVSLRPFYLPREFPQIFITVVYIHPKANVKNAQEIIYNLSQRLETISPDAPKFIMGDFNHCNAKKSLSTYYQYVDSPTRKEKTLDMCYGTVKNAYISTVLPPLGASDHSVVYLRPVYLRLLKREKPQEKSVKVWDNDSIMTLQGCFECTQWEIFSTDDINEQVETVTDYVNFCIDSVIPTKSFKVYPNDKPWVSKNLKTLINEKRKAHRNQDVAGLRDTQRQIKRQIQIDKYTYKQKLEESLIQGNPRYAWQGIKNMTNISHRGRCKQFPVLQGYEELEMANQLNSYYCRFDSRVSDEIPECSVPPDANSSVGFHITEMEVSQIFRKCNPRKSPGPDKICGNVLKHCAFQLAPVFTEIFRVSFNCGIVPVLWKTSTIIPVAKVPKPSELNDYRPIALTSLVMKSFEHLVKKYIVSVTQHLIDPLQFAYQASRGVEDAITTVLHLLHSHLEKPKTHAKILFVDFSSAFNCILPNILAATLTKEFLIDSRTLAWVTNFLSSRIQQVKIGGSISDRLTTSVGAPQGCVLSPLLFILYTNSCVSSFKNRHIVKYADDTALVSLLNDGEDEHGPVLDFFINWCENSNLFLNILKTKEMVIDFREKQLTEIHPTLINGEQIELVTNYKYLGVMLDSKLKWDAWSDCVSKKLQQRMYFLKKLLIFNVNNRILLMFYEAFIESIVSFCVICWYGNASEAQKRLLGKVVVTASKLLGIKLESIDSIYKGRVLNKAIVIVNDKRHPLSDSFKLLPSGRRYCVPKCSKNRFKFSFIPQAIKFLNSSPPSGS